jgi:hypothetical protein
MPESAATAESVLQEFCGQIKELLLEASQFVPRDRGEALMRKWLPRHHREGLKEERIVAMMADGLLLSADLLRCQPDAMGTTAIDRLAKIRRDAPAAAKALAILCQARFRLLQVAGNVQRPLVMARDVISGQKLRIFGTDLAALAPSTPIFALAAMLGDGVCCLPGAITPLNAAALATARGHSAAGAKGVAANARWAEAVYGHVVRYGARDIPGVNRPRTGSDGLDDGWDEGGSEAHALALEWVIIADGVPGEDLLDRTRRLAGAQSIFECLVKAAEALAHGKGGLAAAIERMLLVQMETVLRRERIGSAASTLDRVRNTLDYAVAAGNAPPAASALLASLRRRLGSRAEASRTGDPALEKLVQRIQALRAKTVARGCTEQEALAAAEKVAELLDRHGLSLNELDFRAQPCDGIGIQTTRRRMAPIDNCMTTIAAFFDCRVWVEAAKGAAMRYVFFGLRGDVTAAQYLYEMVERAFEAETDAFRASALYAEMVGERRTAINSFQSGLARGICAKLKKIRAARDKGLRSASGHDLVPVKAAMVAEEMAKLGLALRKQTIGGKKRLLTDAYIAGEAAGQRFEITQGIAQAA